MTSLLATSKSGNDWTQADLLNYGIKVTDLSFQDFFSPLSLTTLPPLPHAIEPYVTAVDHTQATDDSTSKWLHYLDLVQDKPGEVAGGIFADKLLHLLGYDQGRRLILTGYAIPSVFFGVQYSLTADVCICDEDEIILFLAREDQVAHTRGQGVHGVHTGAGVGAFRGSGAAGSNGMGEAEPILIASAISAFQRNNRIREKLGLSQLEETTFPGITFAGTFPTFYRIKMTNKLSQAIETGTTIDTVTDVNRHIPDVPGPKDEGMKDIGNRHTLLQYFVAFKRFLL